MMDVKTPAGAVPRNAHNWEREQHEHYIETRWCDRVLFEQEPFEGFLHDPCCGWGRIPEEARRVGIKGVTGADIVDRGFAGCGIVDFMGSHDIHDNMAFNPPFDIFEDFVMHALRRTRRKVAVILHTQKLNAASWMRQERLQHVWYLTPRPSMPPGRVAEELMISLGKDPSGGTKDYCWAIFNRELSVKSFPTIGWLHRDRGVL